MPQTPDPKPKINRLVLPIGALLSFLAVILLVARQTNILRAHPRRTSLLMPHTLPCFVSASWLLP